LIVRQSNKFSAEGFLLTLLKAVSTGHASFGQMASCLGERESKTLSRQALHQRMKPAAIDFLQPVLQQTAVSTADAGRKDWKLPFRRILLEDATQFRMHSGNHPSFRAVANNSGPTAGAKVDVVFDLISGQLLRQFETEGHVQDRTLGPELLPMVGEGDLVLRDMGYFDVSAIADVESKKAFWLSRLHGQASATSGDGEALETLLAKASGKLLDLEVMLTQKAHRARLVAFRSSPEVASRRRQQKKDKQKSSNRSRDCKPAWKNFSPGCQAA
jgi:hypothetical protein